MCLTNILESIPNKTSPAQVNCTGFISIFLISLLRNDFQIIQQAPDQVVADNAVDGGASAGNFIVDGDGIAADDRATSRLMKHFCIYLLC